MSVRLSWDLDDLVEAYKDHQRRTRGVRDRTLSNYERHVRAFLRSALGDGPVEPGRLTTADVVEFIGSMTATYSPAPMKAVRTALRSFLRYLRGQGVGDERLEAAIPRVAHRRLSTLPRRLSDQQHEQLLESLDTSLSRPCGPRDRAIVWCLATLGLRPGEVAQLCLDDFDWRAGTVTLRQRKNRRGAALRVPHKVGRTVADYLQRHRPSTSRRQVFVQHVGPRRGEPITATAVSEVVARALRRAGIDAPMGGAYVLRQTMASRLVAHGADLNEVADVLGHRDLDTAAIYSKLDVPALREVALPWPGQVGR
jgi:integrase/recombinase XerD